MSSSMIKVLLTRYFNEGCSHIETLAYLNLVHKISISLSTVKRRLKKLRLRRRSPKAFEDKDEVKQAVSIQLLGSGRNLGKNFCVA